LRLAFISAELRILCEDENKAIAKFGRATAIDLQTRLADIIAANTVEDLIAGNPQIINTGEGTQFALDLAGTHRLIFTADHTKNTPRTSGKRIDWPQVNYIQLIEIQQIHER
jgi:hypothetical protein